MSARFNASGDTVSRTANLINYNAAYTFMGWLYISVDLVAASTFCSLSSTNSNFDAFGFNSSLALRSLTRNGGGSPTEVTGTTLNVGEWNHIAMVRTATANLDLYLNGVLDFANTLSTSGRIAIALATVGSNVGDAARYDGRAFGIREWSTNLSAAEIVTEKNSETVVKTVSLVNDVPLSTDALALTGTDFTENGTITYEANPPFAGGVEIFRRRIEGY